MNIEIKQVLDALGGKSLLISLGCRIATTKNSVILCDIKTTKKCHIIQVVPLGKTVEISFYKTKSQKHEKLHVVKCSLLSARQEIIDFTKIDI